jgi:2,4-dienoyl-CoA reductase-like NADH-dependent reductase (Old Yellow Enzyme family)
MNEHLYSSIQIGKLTLSNRLAVAPMTRISATDDGLVTDDMIRYYERYARGGYGLIFTEGTYTDSSYSQGYLHQPGIASDSQAESWRPVVTAVHEQGSKIILQLMHAGALSQGNNWREGAVAPSAVAPRGEQMAFYRGEGPYETPREMTRDEIAEVVRTFTDAAVRARNLGFDGIEVHGANGYLLDQFLTDYTNRRTDEYGGSTEHRVRLTAEILASIRKAVGEDYTVGIRISQAKVNDYDHKWANGEDDARVIFGALAQAGADYIHTAEYDATAPAFGEGESLAALAGKFSGLPVIANGNLGEATKAHALIASEEAEVVALGKSALANPDWPERVRARDELQEFDPQLLQPLAHIKKRELE